MPKDGKYGRAPILGDFDQMVAEMNAPGNMSTSRSDVSAWQKWIPDPKDYVTYSSPEEEIKVVVYGVEFSCLHCKIAFGKTIDFQMKHHLSTCKDQTELFHRKSKERERERAWMEKHQAKKPTSLSSSPLSDAPASPSSSSKRNRGPSSDDDEGYASGSGTHAAKRARGALLSSSEDEVSSSSGTSTELSDEAVPAPIKEEKKPGKRKREEILPAEEPIAKRTRSMTKAVQPSRMLTRSIARAGLAPTLTPTSVLPAKNPKRSAAAKAAWARRRAALRP